MDKHTFQYAFTVFTATYNRAHLLPRVYDSLESQTFRDFEWVIVDDGSTDETRETVYEWIETAPFPIQYTWQPNSGIHVAMNRGFQTARGYLFAKLDSDDWFLPQALERFKYHWETIPDSLKPGFSGVVALYAHPSGEIVGTKFPQDVMDTDNLEMRVRYRVKGDKVAAHRTEVMRQFPFPENLGRYVTPALAWNRRALRYGSRGVNEVLAYADYQPGGLSDTSMVVWVNSPKAARLYYQEFISTGRPLPIDIALRNYANYVRYSLHADLGLMEQIRHVPSKLIWIASLPLGTALYVRDTVTLRMRGQT